MSSSGPQTSLCTRQWLPWHSLLQYHVIEQYGHFLRTIPTFLQ
jgi:hypothetical protein